jgi:hypothetical protein
MESIFALIPEIFHHAAKGGATCLHERCQWGNATKSTKSKQNQTPPPPTAILLGIPKNEFSLT